VERGGDAEVGGPHENSEPLLQSWLHDRLEATRRDSGTETHLSQVQTQAAAKQKAAPAALHREGGGGNRTGHGEGNVRKKNDVLHRFANFTIVLLTVVFLVHE